MAEPQLAQVPPLPHGQRHHLFGATEVHRNLNELKLNFNNVVSKWKYEGLESFSLGNIVVRLGVKEGQITKTRYRRLAIKRALTDNAEDTLRNEIETIQAMHPAEHIIHPIVTCEYPPPPGQAGGAGGAGGGGPAENAADELSRLFRQVSVKAKEAIRDPHIPSRLRGRRQDHRMTTRRVVKELNLAALNDYPYMISEYLENGNLDRLLHRISYHQVPIPNRVLWSIALCMLRACIGMAYGRPSREDLVAGIRGEIPEPRLETIPPGDAGPRGLVHGRIESKNLIFGTPDNFREHSFVAPLKLAGFSQAHMIEDARGPKENLLGMGKMLFILAMNDYNQEILHDSMVQPTIQNGIWTYATLLYEDNPNIDLDLKNLIGYWMNCDPNLMVNVRHVLPLVEKAVEERGEAFYPGVHRETDASVRAFLQLMIYDAAQEPPMLVAHMEEVPPFPLPAFFDHPGDGDGPAEEDMLDGPADEDDDFFEVPPEFHAPEDFPDPPIKHPVGGLFPPHDLPVPPPENKIPPLDLANDGEDAPANEEQPKQPHDPLYDD
ncbi:hypothetical protein F4813DRAFT_174256 [Daldinia decipiens]|uniref:uncharacterized protein n=1 Tax=Daldinia decipiens TaxID=326647 RepID=UPI0020C1C084|nr:uncharacterized protein F4813DRAFT_174256 [Daldinia decipiens]KAI1661824.1 hypothetical protein F4813DRAFT_174256 [Daldinia decipiens]